MRPILLEIVSKVLTTFDQCRHCETFFDQAGLNKKFHQNEMNEYPPDLKEEYVKLSDWIRELRRLYKHRLLIKLIDIQSPLGIYKALRHRIRAYPTFIIEGKETYAGWDKNHLEDLLDRYIRASLPPKYRTV
ncbi:MAG: hypothetical protein MUP27_11350 [Desulfobacterales bacterium]|nr:hypothetical protein [Desulfobacterales bacterium]